MRRASLVLPLAGLVAWSEPLLGASATRAQRQCAPLSSLSLPDVSISEAVAEPAGRAETRNGAVTRSCPLCPYPQKATYGGSGSTDDETNFVCR